MTTGSSSTSPAGLEPWDGRAFEVEVPVLVVGGGACGLTAALAARDAGAEVLVAEQGPRCEGSSAMSLGALCAAGTREQARRGVEDDAAVFLADIMAKTRGQADPELAALVARESGPALDWLAKAPRRGLPVRRRLAAGLRPQPRAPARRRPSRTGADMMSRLAAACARGGGRYPQRRPRRGPVRHRGGRGEGRAAAPAGRRAWRRSAVARWCWPPAASAPTPRWWPATSRRWRRRATSAGRPTPATGSPGARRWAASWPTWTPTRAWVCWPTRRGSTSIPSC